MSFARTLTCFSHQPIACPKEMSRRMRSGGSRTKTATHVVARNFILAHLLFAVAGTPVIARSFGPIVITGKPGSEGRTDHSSVICSLKRPENSLLVKGELSISTEIAAEGNRSWTVILYLVESGATQAWVQLTSEKRNTINEAMPYTFALSPKYLDESYIVILLEGNLLERIRLNLNSVSVSTLPAVSIETLLERVARKGGIMRGSQGQPLTINLTNSIPVNTETE